MPAPTRDTSEMDLDQWNQHMRSSPIYAQYLASIGKSVPQPGQKIKLSRDQQAGLERTLAQNGMSIPGGMHIDQGGNLNQKNRLVRNTAITAAITGAALTGLGAAGMGPLSGMFGGTVAAGGAAGAAGGVVGPGAAAGLASGLTPAMTAGMMPIAPAAWGGAAAAGGGLGSTLLNVGKDAAQNALKGGGQQQGGGNPFMNFLSGTFGGKAGLVNAGLQLGSGILGSRAAGKASRQQVDASNRAMALYDPYLKGGQAAYGRLSDMLMNQAAPQPGDARSMFPVVMPGQQRPAPGQVPRYQPPPPSSQQMNLSMMNNPANW